MWDFGRLFQGSEAPVLAFTALTGLVHLLAARGRRQPRVHAFEDHAVAADERAVLSLCAALQAGHRDHAEALLRWLLPAAARGAGLTYAAALAGMMAENGARLYPRRRALPGAMPCNPRPVRRQGSTQCISETAVSIQDILPHTSMTLLRAISPQST